MERGYQLRVDRPTQPDQRRQGSILPTLILTLTLALTLTVALTLTLIADQVRDPVSLFWHLSRIGLAVLTPWSQNKFTVFEPRN